MYIYVEIISRVANVLMCKCADVLMKQPGANVLMCRCADETAGTAKANVLMCRCANVLMKQPGANVLMCRCTDVQIEQPEPIS